MRIQCNVMAENTHRMYAKNNEKVSKSAEKLSSGYRINRASDDAAGLAISEKMRAQVRGLNMASKNSQDAISLIQTAEGAMQEIHSMLQRMNELANQAASDTNQTFDREQINAEFIQLKSEIDDVAEQTTFNKMKLLDGSLSSGASKAMEDTANSTLKLNGSLGATGNTYVFTAQTGLSNQIGKYEFTAAADVLTVKYTDAATGNVTNTVIDMNDVISGDAVKGGAFKVDLSASGFGVLSLTADSANTTVDATTIATAFNGLVTTTIAAVPPAANGGALTIQVGANEGDTLSVSVEKMSTTGLGLSTATIADRESAGHAITSTQNAVDLVSEQRGALGAMQNRLEHKIANLDNTSENVAASESRIRDCDIAKEMTGYTKNNILSQAANAMLSQANANPQNVLSLFQ